MKIEELREKIRLHALWRQGDPAGQRADLQGAYLQGADLQRADLQGAYLQRADLQGAYLQGAYLQGAYLQGADLQRADLQRADLQGADLQRADLQRADLQRADLQGAYLQGADLRGADLQGAYLQRADLQGAYLRGAYLRGAYLRGADLQRADLQRADLDQVALAQNMHRVSIVPQDGPFWAYKAVRCSDTLKVVILQLEVPATARRLGGLVGRKCRVEEAIVLNATFPDGTSFTGQRMHSDWNEGFAYAVGQLVKPDSFDENPADECSNGIHVFLTRLEAVEYRDPRAARQLIDAMAPAPSSTKHQGADQ